MRRRMIPPAISLAVLFAVTLPLMSGNISERSANLWLLAAVTTVFAFKTVLFFWMRQRMVHNRHDLTVFGMAIADFFSSLTILAGVLTYVFGLLYYMVAHDHTISHSMQTINRITIAVSGSLVVTTGVAVAWEMHRAGEDLTVHISDKGAL